MAKPPPTSFGERTIQIDSSPFGSKLPRCLRRGSFNEIPKAAKALAVDLIVLGAQGRTGLDRLMMGSVAEGVVQKASCPIFLVKPKSMIG